MNILLIYATNSSGTLVASELIRDTLQNQKHDVTMKRANQVELADLKAKFDLVILGSCTWGRVIDHRWVQGQLQDHLFELRAKLIKANLLLPGHKFAVFALGDSSYTEFGAAADKLVAMVNDLGGELVAEPLKIDGWFFHQEDNEKKLAAWTKRLAAG